MSTCKPVTDYNFTTPPADYSLVYQYTAKVDSVEHLVIALNPSEMFLAKPGDVLGWTFTASASSGQVTYAAVAEASNDSPEFEFPMVSQIGGLASRSAGVKRNTQHIMSAHFASKAYFSLHHVYNSTGAYYLTTNIAPTVVVYVDSPISGVTLQCPKLLATNSTTELIIPAHNGTNTTYDWSAGDGRLVTTTTNGRYGLRYHNPGTYLLSLAAYNSLGRVTKSCVVRALDKVSGLRLLESIAPVALGEHTVISWTVQHGTNLSYTLDLGDGSAKQVYDMSGKPDNKVTVRHKYARIGIHNITIQANSIIGPLLVMSSKAVIQIPLANMKFVTTLLHVSKNVYIAKGDVVELKVVLGQGSNPVCTYAYGDGSAGEETDSLTVKHVYSKLGEHKASVTCKNDISEVSAVLNATAIVQELEEIADLKLMATATPFGNATDISIQMRSGSVYFCDWMFGDGSKHRTDFEMNIKPVKHTYSTIGNYAVHVTCRNRLGMKTAKVTIPVDVPITGLQLECPPAFIRVGQPFEVKVSTLTGSRVEVIFNLGLGESLKRIHQSGAKNSTIKHSYTKPGIYDIKVTTKNEFNSMEQGCVQKTKVEYPVSGVRIVSNSPLTFVPGTVKYSWFPSPDFIPPTDAVVSWDFGDGHKLPSALIDFSNMSTLIGTYRYNMTGVYVTKVQIENNVSSIAFHLEIDVQKMLPVSLTIAMKNPVTHEVTPGFGMNNDFFPLESELSLSVTKQAKDNWYLFDLGNGQTLNSSLKQVAYTYPSPGRYNVTVSIDNVLQKTQKWEIISVQASIKRLTLTVDPITQLKSATKFAITADAMGSNACYILTLGDGNVTVFSNVSCDLVEYKTNKYVYKPLPATSFTYNHTYTVKGKYSASLEAKNVVSFGKVVKGIEVIYKPCAMPAVEVQGGGLALSPRNILRSDRIILRANVNYSCDKASHVVYTWSIFKGSDASGIGRSNPLNVTTSKAALPLVGNTGGKDPAIYEIAENQLHLGLTVVQLKVTFESATHDVADVIGSSDIWLNTQATPLKAIIKGKVL